MSPNTNTKEQVVSSFVTPTLKSIMNDKPELKNPIGNMVYSLIKVVKSIPKHKRKSTIHAEVTETIAYDKKKQLDGKHTITCRKGCAHCCYLNVSIYPFEAKDYASYIRKGGWYNKTEYEVQKTQGVKEKSANPSPCIFLNNNECTIYDKRPFLCRAYFVVDENPKNCIWDGEKPIKVKRPALFQTSILDSALVNVYPEIQHSSMAKTIEKYLRLKNES